MYGCLFGKYSSRIARDIRYRPSNDDVAVVSPGVAWRVPLASEMRAEFAYGNVIDEAVAAGRKPMPGSLGILHPAGGESLSSFDSKIVMVQSQWRPGHWQCAQSTYSSILICRSSLRGDLLLTVPRSCNLASSYRTAQPRTLLIGVRYA
jgi:hypothetical protein